MLDFPGVRAPARLSIGLPNGTSVTLWFSGLSRVTLSPAGAILRRKGEDLAAPAGFISHLQSNTVLY
jgi:hypothetical protein